MMTREELHKLLDQAAEQIRILTDAAVGWDELIKGAAAMRANEDAQIYQHLSEGFRKLLDPNTYPTLSDPQGHRKTVTIGGHTLELVVKVARQKRVGQYNRIGPGEGPTPLGQSHRQRKKKRVRKHHVVTTKRRSSHAVSRNFGEDFFEYKGIKVDT